MNAQKRVAQAVEERGYREGWTAEQFVARQICKLGEELGELADTLRSSGAQVGYLKTMLEVTAYECRDTFSKSPNAVWNGVFVADPPTARAELADIQVVVFALAEALAELAGEPFDVVMEAEEKALADVRRGVR